MRGREGFEMNIRSFTYGFGSVLLCLALGFMTQMACARVESGAGVGSASEQEVRAVLREASENELKRDRAVAERLMADDFIRSGPNGEVWDRAQTLANFPQAESSPLKSVEFKDERIRIYGDTAVVTGLGVANGAGFVVHNRCTFVLVKRDGRWQVVAIQQTRAPV